MLRWHTNNAFATLWSAHAHAHRYEIGHEYTEVAHTAGVAHFDVTDGLNDSPRVHTHCARSRTCAPTVRVHTHARAPRTQPLASACTQVRVTGHAGTATCAVGAFDAVLCLQHAVLRLRHAVLRLRRAVLRLQHAVLRLQHAVLRLRHAVLRSQRAVLHMRIGLQRRAALARLRACARCDRTRRLNTSRNAAQNSQHAQPIAAAPITDLRVCAVVCARRRIG